MAATLQRSPAPILVHIGYHKTGTTWLQRNVFDNPAAGFLCPWGRQPWLAVEHFVLGSPFRFDAHAVRQVFAEGLEQARKQSLVPVLSHEALSGPAYNAARNPRQSIERLAAVFPQARIVIGVREQVSGLVSLYGQYVREGGTERLQNFLDHGRHSSGFAPLCPLHRLEYDLPVSYCQDRFGRENVLVLPLEWLRDRMDAYLEAIQTLAGTGRPIHAAAGAANPALSPWTLSFLRRINAWIPREHRRGPNPLRNRLITRGADFLDRRCLPRAVRDRSRSRVIDWVRDRVGDHYAESNRRLSELSGIDLGELGYRCQGR